MPMRSKHSRRTGDIFDPATAKRLHDYIYAAGGSRDPAEAYKAFRGRLPSADALLAQARLRRDPRLTLRSRARLNKQWLVTWHSRRSSPRRRLRAARRSRRSGPRHSRRRRQRDRGHAGDGGHDRRRLSAHEPRRRRRILADPRAERPRPRNHGGGTGRPQRAARALSRVRDDTAARTARGADRAGRGRRLDAGARSGEGATAPSCRSMFCSPLPSRMPATATR